MTAEPSGQGEPMSLSDSARRATLDPRTRLLLEAPIAGTLLRLATPNVLVMVVQASVGLIETYFKYPTKSFLTQQ